MQVGDDCSKMFDSDVGTCSLFSALREPSVNRKYLQALTIVGLSRDYLEIDPLAVLHLYN